MGHVTVTMPFPVVCHPWDRTCYSQPPNQIWSLYLHPLRRHNATCRK